MSQNCRLTTEKKNNQQIQDEGTRSRRVFCTLDQPWQSQRAMLSNFSLYRQYRIFSRLVEVSTSRIRSRSPNSRGADKKGWHNVLLLVDKDIYVQRD